MSELAEEEHVANERDESTSEVTPVHDGIPEDDAAEPSDAGIEHEAPPADVLAALGEEPVEEQMDPVGTGSTDLDGAEEEIGEGSTNIDGDEV